MQVLKNYIGRGTVLTEPVLTLLFGFCSICLVLVVDFAF